MSSQSHTGFEPEPARRQRTSTQSRRIAAVAAVVHAVAVIAVGSPAHAAVLVVESGQSIQAAVDAAPPGSRIEVRPGRYAESVRITKDGITLVGAGPSSTVIVPPAEADPACFPGLPSGICVLGSVDPTTLQVLDAVEGVHVSGFFVTGFPGFGIRVRGARGTSVTGNAAHGNLIGIFDSLSANSRHADNTISGSTEEGVLVRGATGTVLTGNASYDNTGQGVLVVDSSGGRLRGNRIHGNCEGLALVDFGDGVAQWVVAGNTVSGNTRACAATAVQPPLSGIGIDIVGARDTVVENNTVDGNTPSGPTIHSGGIVVTTSPFDGGIDPMRNRVVSNTAHGNQPADIVWNGKGAGNRFFGNDCDASIPAGLCP